MNRARNKALQAPSFEGAKLHDPNTVPFTSYGFKMLNATVFKYLLGHQDLFCSGWIAIDAPWGHALLVADCDGKASVIGSRHFDHQFRVRTFQMETFIRTGICRFLALHHNVRDIWNKNFKGSMKHIFGGKCSGKIGLKMIFNCNEKLY